MPDPVDAHDVIRARHFVVTDASGRDRAHFGTGPDGDTVKLTFLDTNGKNRLSMGIEPNGTTALYLLSQDEKSRITLHVDSEGAPMVQLDAEDEQHSTFVHFSFDVLGIPEPVPLFTMRKAKGPLFEVTLEEHLQRLRFVDQNEKTRLGLISMADGSTAIVLLDNQETVRAQLSLESDGSPRLQLFDSKGDTMAGLIEADSKGHIHLAQ